jgi:prophage antirepressor-like protein
MKNIFETLDENYILFDKIKIHIIIDNTDKIWFSCKEILSSLEYKDIKDAMKVHIDKDNKIQLKNINHSINTKQHPNTIFINESGLYKLIFKSKMKKAKIFTNWVTNDVLPSIRKYGYYKMKKTYEKDKNDLLEKINYLEKQNKLMINDMKKEKYKNGAVVYIIDYGDDPNYEANLKSSKDDFLPQKKSATFCSEKNVYRLGSTDDMNKRKKIYDTHTLHKRPVVEKYFTEKAVQLESCIRSMLYDYRYKNKKDFFLCNRDIIKKAFKNCIKSIKNMKDIQKGGYNEIDTLKLQLDKLDKEIENINKHILY